MRSKEYRIYLDGLLVNICCNQYALMCNVTSLQNSYGKDRVEVKVCDGEMDQEKREYSKELWR